MHDAPPAGMPPTDHATHHETQRAARDRHTHAAAPHAAGQTKRPKGENLKLQKIPQLVKLQHGSPYCEDCGDIQHEGWLVAWWPVNGRAAPTTVVCAACHHDRVRAIHPHKRRRRR